MKKLILPLMLLLFVGALFAVESDPSAVVGYVKYDLVAGNNTIALPMDQGFTQASAVGDNIGATAIAYFNVTSQAWVPITKGPFGWSSNFTVSEGQALWATVPSARDFYSIGDLPVPEPTYALVAGNNTIMVPLSKSDLITASLVGNNINASAIAYFNKSSQAWVPITKGPFGWSSNFDTSIGDPLWVTTANAGTWPGRGIPAFSSKDTK